MVGKGETGNNELAVRARENRLKGRSKREKGDTLLLSKNYPLYRRTRHLLRRPSPWDGIQQPAGGFPGLAGWFQGLSSACLPSQVLRTFVGIPDSPGFNPSLSLSPSSAGIDVPE